MKRRRTGPIPPCLDLRLAIPLVATFALLGCGSGSDPLPSPSGTPVALNAIGGDGQIGLSGVPLPDSLVVVVRGDDGPLADVAVDWTALGAGEVRPARTLTDRDGRAMALWAPGAGADSVRAQVGAFAHVFRGEGGAASGATRWLGRNGYVEYRAGTLPLVISAPHGGTMEPTEIPDRSVGTVVRDTNTDLLALAIADALEARTGQRPHLIVSHLHRRKLDPNREIVEAAGGDARAEHAWSEFQGLIDHARSRVTAERGAGFYIDLHGHGHAIPRLELGYLLGADALARSDAELNQGPWATDSSIRALVADAGVPFTTILRGPESLGSLLEEAGYPATPSDAQPDPGDNPFFSGGYNTARHGSAGGGSISGVQVEANYAGVRDSQEARSAFATALADALMAFLARWY